MVAPVALPRLDGYGRQPLSAATCMLATAAACWLGCWLLADSAHAADVSFNRDIRPILADKCFHCHGPDSNVRQAGLRLDRPGKLHAEREGRPVIAAGAPEHSELYLRVTSMDHAARMPPAEQDRQLSAAEIGLLRSWISEGGEYEPHWAFIPPQRPKLPPVAKSNWARNPIDRFVLAKLEAEGLEPSPPADKTTLIRRVTLDLTGLPPTPAEVDAFLADEAPQAYKRLVDRLLQSPAYGERMALVWLDAARFADSGGYQGDILRSMWMWRDWVINAYNQGMSFDRFSMEQLAGDLLPEATRQQRIATGFNRNHRINDEDGIIHEEYRVEYVVDRVETTATVWLGLTMGCARCHDHKYDPITHREFYQFYAFFNSVNESGRGHGNAPPLLSVLPPKDEQRVAGIDREIASLVAGDAAAKSDRKKRITRLQKQRDALVGQAPTTMVMEELSEPRETFVLVRGAYNQPSERVAHGVPAAFHQGQKPLVPNRIGLANWLLDPANPLTARVAVNRYWMMYFGRGLVATPEDFGTQGALPTHPRLLDWLAAEFVRSHWDVKAMQRLLVTSATYRQASNGSQALQERDPNNTLLARGPRFRLHAETIRDQMLSASGLLVARIGGPSVRPYQPPGLWFELTSANPKYEPDKGESLYRRSLYTFIRRTVPPPNMTVIDAPNRETCSVRRPRTNTPLQALALMNDPIVVEAARVLAERVMLETAEDARARIVSLFRLLLARLPSELEERVLLSALERQLARYQHAAGDAELLLAVGESAPYPGLPQTEVAALASVAMLLFNLDETISKE